MIFFDAETLNELSKDYPYIFIRKKVRNWISINEFLPEDGHCVEFASHQHYGLANWSKEKGFYEVFLTMGRGEPAEYCTNSSVWNDEIMWWRPISIWPHYGVRGCDAKLMKDYTRK